MRIEVLAIVEAREFLGDAALQQKSAPSVKIRAAQVESAFLADHFATMPAQLGRAVRADRGGIGLHNHRPNLARNLRRYTVRNLNPRWRSG
jgi:hypothetical protein